MAQSLENPLPPATAAAAPPADLTPAMRQYWDQKREVGDALLLFRMGDFYELFYEDAERAAKLLGITLTSRDSGKTPMAGIPYHALEGYLRKLVQLGVRVAISEQIDDPKLTKGLIRRSVSRIVTPGTLTDEALLEGHTSNILAALLETPLAAGIAALELSTGRFEVQLVPPSRVMAELTRLAAAEVLLPERTTPGRNSRDDLLKDQLGVAVTFRNPSDFSPARTLDLFERFFATRRLEGFGFEEIDPSLQAAGAILAYVQETQRGDTSHLRPPRRRDAGESLQLDPTTLRSLEIERTLRSGARAGSLLSAVDHTCTPMGARLLRTWLCYPLLDRARIAERQRFVGALIDSTTVRRNLRARLRDAGDLERIVGRVGVQRVSPRDLRALGDTLALLPALRSDLAALHLDDAAALGEALTGLDELAQLLTSQLRSDAPLALREGGIFNDSVNAELDRLRIFARDGQAWLAQFQAQEVARTGIPTLKVAFNRVHGFYIEITNPHRERVPPEYVRRQTVKNAERYITDELKRYEGEALSAESRANQLEYELFDALRRVVAERVNDLQRAASAVAAIDVLAGWASLASDRRYCRPLFVDEPILEIDEGRHPVVEPLLGSAFTPNDTRLTATVEARSAASTETSLDIPPGVDDADTLPRDAGPTPSLALITGPNMAGKSTYIRQVALLTLLAHCGCWVPARRMRLGMVDRIFTRVGAADELARGQSTFMVEMLETANILNNATPHSLVILDEVGRGTSTFDGLALAWAITEHLASSAGCRSLFATHYHELTEIATLLPNVANLNVAVREYDDQIVFLHKIVAGAAGMSYGLHVARLAGVPQGVIERANVVLAELEKHFSREAQRPVLAAAQRRRLKQLKLFESPSEVVLRELAADASDPARLDPAALAEMVRRWRAMAQD
ncbi:MAG: DNA mismatch repair protein MutS [Phycisphaerae bacterium]|nr:DNA mismatch repair protein MutS [Phycisphaerae bacterium]